MILTINGQRKEIAAQTNVNDLLKAEGFADMVVAVARNGSFVQRDLYDDTYPEDDDEIEIVAPMQGG